MKEYIVKNKTIKCGGEDFLVSGSAFYVIEDYDEDGQEALFDSAKIHDALNRNGYITSPEVLTHLQECLVETLNKDSTLCRQLGYK